MITIRQWVAKLTHEPIEFIQIGEMGWCDYNEEGKPPEYKNDIGKILSYEEGAKYIDYQFECGYGAPACLATLVYTKTYIISICQYDGLTSPFIIPRNALAGFIPDMPGG